MRKSKTLTAEVLAELGADRLAALLLVGRARRSVGAQPADRSGRLRWGAIRPLRRAMPK